MNCPECGQEGRSKFCTHCGAPLVRLVAATHETAHFRIHCPAGSFASQNLQSIEERLERCYDIASAMVDVTLRSGLVDVYLSELVVHQQPHGLGSAGYAVPSRMQIHDVYRTDAPGESLERSVVTLLLALITENDRPVAPGLVDGLLGLVVARPEVIRSADETGHAVFDLVNEGRLPSISTVLLETASDAVPDERCIHRTAAIDLTGFLVERYGLERWKGFVKLLQSTNPQQAASVALGRRLEQLEREWTANIRRRAAARPTRLLPAPRWSWSQWSSLLYRAAPLAGALCLTIIAGFVLWLAAGREINPQSLAACLVLAGVTLSQTVLLLQAGGRAVEAAERYERSPLPARVAAVPQESRNPRPILPLARGVRLEGVSLDDRDGETPLRNLNMTFPAGATVAIVGDVGCGASRLADLCLRLRDPEVGRITFDGLDVREVGLAALRGEVAVATADGVLLNGTIAENLRLAHPEATDSDLELATRLAGVHQAIVGLVKGYDTRLEDGGDRLPVLVRRRLSLARALLHDPSVLIADRLGEGLDPAAEAQLYGALERAGDGRLTLLITSRVRWASCADRIYVMERGRVVEQGMHDDLVRRDTLYARLWREQEDEASAGEATKRRAAYLQRVPTFAPLPPHLQDLIAEEMELQRLQQGDEIVRAGDVMDRLVVVQSGMIEVVASDPVLRGKTVARLYRGDCCGEMALLHDGLRGAGLRAGSPVELYTLRRVDFFRLLRRAPELEDRLRRVMAERTQISRRRDSGHLSALQTVRLPQRAAG